MNLAQMDESPEEILKNFNKEQENGEENSITNKYGILNVDLAFNKLPEKIQKYLPGNYVCNYLPIRFTENDREKISSVILEHFKHFYLDKNAEYFTLKVVNFILIFRFGPSVTQIMFLVYVRL